jgi:DNA anti-recombination protein RmuC
MIDNLTSGMSRLSEEISALRHNRAVLACDLVLGRANLGNSVSEMIAGFQSDRQQMREKTKAERDEARADLEHTISEMIAGFQSDREEMGEKTKAERDEARTNLKHTISEMIAGFQSDRQQMGEKTRVEVGECVSNVRDAVAGLRAEFASDLAGAHAAWSGSQKRAQEAHPNIRRKKR